MSITNQSVTSSDGVSINFECSGQGETAILFVHGWLGSLRWWDFQRDSLSNHYRVIQMDLAGHGRSSVRKNNWSVKAYAEDIKAVADSLDLKKVILVGHSMSGSNVVEAYHLMANRVSKIILVDTLLDLDHLPTMKEAGPLFDGMRVNFKSTMEVSVPNFLMSKTSPKVVVDRILQEFLSASPEIAISSLEPFYTTNILPACSKVKVPVRAINSDLYPTNVDANRKYFSDYECEVIRGVGHYPMLEAPEKFNEILNRLL